ncbi:MAG: phosphatidylglycerophosphatase A [Phycisphaerae bacterium]
MTFFGCGDTPIASGTWGSAGALVVAAIWFGGCQALLPITLAATVFHVGLGVGLIVASVLCVRWGRWAIATFADHPNTRKPGDPGAVVLDEVAGQWLALIALPMGGVGHAAIIAVVQFFGFRIADIFKPPPGRWLEHLPDGWGILLDDLSSALYVNLAAQLVFRFWLGWV